MMCLIWQCGKTMQAKLQTTSADPGKQFDLGFNCLHFYLMYSQDSFMTY